MNFFRGGEGSKHHVWTIALIFSFLIFGIIHLDKYSMTPDEPNSLRRGELTAELVKSLLFQGWQFSSQQIDELRSLRHPPFFSTINFWFSTWVRGALGLETINSAHVLILLMSSFSLWLMFLIGRSLWSGPVGILSALLLAIYPRFLGNAQTNPKDIPLLGFSLAAVYFLLRYQERPRSGFLISAAMCHAMGITSELNGLFLLPVVIWLLFPSGIVSSATVRVFAKRLALYVGVLCLGIFLLWPLLWVDPQPLWGSIQYFSSLKRTEEVLYFGQRYLSTDLPFHYVWFYVFATLPVLVVLFFFVGVWWLLKGGLPQKRKMMVLLFLWTILPVVARCIPGVSRYDGIRHLLFAMPPILIVASLGVYHSALIALSSSSRAAILGALVFLGLMLREVWKIFPYENSYFNEVVRAIYPRNIDAQFEFPIWFSPNRDGVKWLNENAERESKICAMPLNKSIEYYVWRDDLEIGCENPDYKMLLPSARGEMRGYRIIYSIERYNSTILTIGKKENEGV